MRKPAQSHRISSPYNNHAELCFTSVISASAQAPEPPALRLSTSTYQRSFHCCRKNLIMTQEEEDISLAKVTNS
ncbi:hypothetical protein Q7C36_012208 [Tachysurus vachellii]|uniref:Uncharacterized protein n=1 Tax=Tachysurus vachellii TaxID=175792 RepID=A0AA88SIT0_TACVA|nr:hypothetical protein Q7C36_012208 [Tachysurus vachellii]